MISMTTLLFAPVEAGRFSEILNVGQSQDSKKEERIKDAERHPILGDLMEEEPSSVLSKNDQKPKL